jgi:hypothetical protein
MNQNQLLGSNLIDNQLLGRVRIGASFKINVAQLAEYLKNVIINFFINLEIHLNLLRIADALCRPSFHFIIRFTAAFLILLFDLGFALIELLVKWI